VRCPGCAAEISPLRDICPHCGASTDSVFDRLDHSAQRSPEQLQRNRKVVLAVVGGILLLTVGMRGFHTVRHISIPHETISIDTRRVTNEAVTIGAPELFEAYHTDSQAADRRFGGRQIVVTGEFLRTVPDGYGSIDMRLKTNHPDLPLGIDLDGHSVDAATKLEAGETVTLSCQEVAGTGDDPWLRDCVLQPPPVAAAPPAPTVPTAPNSPPGPPAPPPPR
jgi:hypothetical protein